MKLIFWGAGNVATQMLELNILSRLPDDVQILGFADIDKLKWGKTIGEYIIFSPYQIKEMEYDSIVIVPTHRYKEIYEMLVYWFGFEPSKVKEMLFLLKLLLIGKYHDSNDEEIKEILNYWQKNELTIFNQYIEVGKELHEVFWDNIENMPYILFEDKRMYYPIDFVFDEIEGRKVVLDLMSEQQPTSPHLYIKDDIKVDEGDVIADVGVCEGNFALKYVERASKVYLFECESKWVKPLEKTFEKFRDKVELHNCFVGRYDKYKAASLDSVIKGRLDFLKMDIEGAEVDALIGGRQTLINNNVKCSICSYHRVKDETAISDLLKAYGYKTSHSNGYMVFWYDSDIWSCPELRRGIVYGIKQ